MADTASNSMEDGASGMAAGNSAAATATTRSPRAIQPVSASAAFATTPDPPVRRREIVSVALLVLLADATIYNGYGFAGYAAFLLPAAVLLLFAAPHLRPQSARWPIVAMLVLLSAKLVWSGTGAAFAAGLFLLAAYAMTLTGRRPYVLDVFNFGVQACIAGGRGLLDYVRSMDKLSPNVPRSAWAPVLLPIAAVCGFGTLFVLANPDVVTWFASFLEWLFENLLEFVSEFAPSAPEVLFWFAVAWVTAGLLRPILHRSVFDPICNRRAAAKEKAGTPAEAPLFAAFRNTLWAVIALFATYLVFEFQSLWFREFPEGFYYSGYAHEGAAWLTIALTAATLVLSAVFRGPVLHDPRLHRLQRLAWFWSAQNVLLAAAVYHRLFIYVDFNGMTRMRTVGLFGITTVLVGFCLVIWKIVQGRDFVWLIRRQLWALAAAVFLFMLVPVDALVHRYNVRRILAGDPAPSVQISVHPIDSAGVMVLHPLLQADDAIIREGVRALLAERWEHAEATARLRVQQGWTSYQMADRLLLDQLQNRKSDLQRYAETRRRADALAKFHEYAYQWY